MISRILVCTFLVCLNFAPSLLAACAESLEAAVRLPEDQQEPILSNAYSLLKRELKRIEKIKNQADHPEAAVIAKAFGLVFFHSSEEVFRAYEDWLEGLLTLVEAGLIPILKKKILDRLDFEKILENVRNRLTSFPDFPYESENPFGKFVLNHDLIAKTFRVIYTASEERMFNESSMADFVELRALRKYATYFDIRVRQASQDRSALDYAVKIDRLDFMKRALAQGKVEFTDLNIKETAKELSGSLTTNIKSFEESRDRALNRILQIIASYPELAKTQNLSGEQFLIAYAFMGGRNDQIAGCCFRGCSGCVYMKALALPKELPGLETSALAYFVAVRELRKIIPQNYWLPPKSPSQMISAIEILNAVKH